jgi:hypothetical protein
MEIATSFNTLRFAHIYREQNWAADVLSKKVLQALEGKTKYNKWIEGHEGPSHFLHIF